MITRTRPHRVILALNLLFLLLLPTSEASAGVEQLRWLAGADAGSPIAGYIVHVGLHSGRYVVSLDVGLPTPDSQGIYEADINVVADSGTFYFALEAYDQLDRHSLLSNEIVRHPDVAPVFDEVFGSVGDVPIVGDWDGDGDADIGYVERKSDGLHFHFLNRGDPPASPPSVVIGSPNEHPVVGNWRHNGKDLAGVIRCKAGSCGLYASLPGSPPGVLTHIEYDVLGEPVLIHRSHPIEGFPISVEYLNGTLDFFYPDFSVSKSHRIQVGSNLSPQVVPLLGNWQIQGVDVPGFAEVLGDELVFFMYDSSAGNLQSMAFGQPSGDTAISGDWDGDGITDIGVVRELEGKLVFLLTLAPYRCANGLFEPGEWCDDGNTSDGDGCSSLCTLEAPNTSLDSDGDGVHDFADNCPLAPNPQQGNVDDDALGDVCDAQSCGNGLVEPGEFCDDSNSTSQDGCSARCANEFCGDGVRQVGLGEECDDGNLTNGDGCSDLCKSEIAFIPGDANRDGHVDGLDFSVWATDLGKSVAPGDGADFNANGVVDADDYPIWLEHYGESLP